MILAYFFGAASLLFFLLFCDRLSLLLFFHRERRRFEKEGSTKAYLENLEKRLKKTKRAAKKSVYLDLMYRSVLAQGETKKADALLPFLLPRRLPWAEKKEAN